MKGFYIIVIGLFWVFGMTSLNSQVNRNISSDTPQGLIEERVIIESTTPLIPASEYDFEKTARSIDVAVSPDGTQLIEERVVIESTTPLIPASEYDFEKTVRSIDVAVSPDGTQLIEERVVIESTTPLIPASEYDLEKRPTPTVEVNSDVPNNLKEQERENSSLPYRTINSQKDMLNTSPNSIGNDEK